MATGQRRSASGAFPLRKMRLSGNETFRKLYRTGRRFETIGLRLFWVPGTDHSTRLATVVRKKTVKHAVDRNRIRRVIRETVRKEMEFFPSPLWLLFDIREFPTEGGFRTLRTAAEHAIAEGPRCVRS